MRSRSLWTPALRAALLLALVLDVSCKGDPATTAPPAAPPEQGAAKKSAPAEAAGGVLATVNGVPIYDVDVDQALRTHKRPPSTDPAIRNGVVETLIRQELAYQHAVSLGLDKNERYQRELQRLEAAARAYKREGIQDALYKREMEARAVVGDDEVRAFYEANGPRLRAEIHIYQIMARNEDDIVEVDRKLKGGEDFDAVALARFRTPPPGGKKPWDLGYLRWKQMPEPWRDIVFDLKPGQTSGIIHGEGGRFWIVKVVDRKDVADATLDSLKPMITDDLRNQKLRVARTALDQELRSAATIQRFEPAP